MSFSSSFFFLLESVAIFVSYKVGSTLLQAWKYGGKQPIGLKRAKKKDTPTNFSTKKFNWPYFTTIICRFGFVNKYTHAKIPDAH